MSDANVKTSRTQPGGCWPVDGKVRDMIPENKPRRKKQTILREDKERLFESMAFVDITIGEATRRMREIVGFNQKDYAEKVLKIYPRVLQEIEKDRGNPTLKTLDKIAKPFGLKIGFVKK